MNAALVSCVLLLAVAADAEETYILCGRQLAAARTLVCFGSKDAGKRSGGASLLALLSHGEWPRGGSQDEWNRRSALAGSWARSKRTDGIVDECCVKGCRMTELMEYCP